MKHKWQDVAVAALRAALVAVLTLLADVQLNGGLTEAALAPLPGVEAVVSKRFVSN